MNVLWYVNIIMPGAANLFSLPQSNSGGWLINQSKILSNLFDIKLTICTVTNRVAEIKVAEKENIKYVLIPNNQKEYKNNLEEQLDSLKPDIVHIFGTEYAYNTNLTEICNELNLKFVVSIQGFMTEYAKHYSDGLPERFNKINPLIWLMGKIYYADSIALNKEAFRIQGQNEFKALQITKNVIGRTSWDKNCVKKANNTINYYHVNECLRGEFYQNEVWSYEKCEKHSIFISQALYPIKGFHKFLNVLPRLIKKYPNIKIHVAGAKHHSLNNKFLDVVVDYFFEYQGYIKNIMKKNNLESYIVFEGSLDAEKMKAAYLKSNLFLSASTIENSPNSVGEAMMLAVPIVASDVGGTSSIVNNNTEALLYDFNDEETLYANICKIFDDEAFAKNIGENAKRHAITTHNVDINTNQLLNVYREICSI